MLTLEQIKKIMSEEFSDIVLGYNELRSRLSIGSNKIRIFMKDNSYIDIFSSDTGKLSCHWERRSIDGTIYRIDNAPDHKEISTYPWHLHEGTEDNVKSYVGSDSLIESVRNFLLFARSVMKL